jgi:hypothetical protein
MQPLSDLGWTGVFYLRLTLRSDPIEKPLPVAEARRRGQSCALAQPEYCFKLWLQRQLSFTRRVYSVNPGSRLKRRPKARIYKIVWGQGDEDFLSRLRPNVHDPARPDPMVVLGVIYFTTRR